jgi:hypothetical protein
MEIDPDLPMRGLSRSRIVSPVINPSPPRTATSRMPHDGQPSHRPTASVSWQDHLAWGGSLQVSEAVAS